MMILDAWQLLAQTTLPRRRRLYFFHFFFALEHFQDFLKWPHQSFESIFFQPPFQVGFSYHTIYNFHHFYHLQPTIKMSGLFFVHMNQPHPTGIATCDHQQHSSCHGMAVGRIDHSQMESQAGNESNARVQRISKFPYEIVEILHTARYSNYFDTLRWPWAMAFLLVGGTRDFKFHGNVPRVSPWFTSTHTHPSWNCRPIDMATLPLRILPCQSHRGIFRGPDGPQVVVVLRVNLAGKKIASVPFQAERIGLRASTRAFCHASKHCIWDQWAWPACTFCSQTRTRVTTNN